MAYLVLMPAAAVLAPRNATPDAPTRTCYDASCNWARSSVEECECTGCCGAGHGGAYRVTELCACGDIAGECFC